MEDNHDRLGKFIPESRILYIWRKTNMEARRKISNAVYAVTDRFCRAVTKKRSAAFITAASVVASSVGFVSAKPENTGTGIIDNFVEQINSWLIAIGGVVVLVGIIQFALSFQREDSEGKSRALMTIMAGALVASAVTVAKAVGVVK